MATDFSTNLTTTKGGLRPTATDTPLDIRTRVETEADILTIPTPFVGMLVYVKDTGKRFEVLTLKDKKVGPIVTKNALVDQYRELPYAIKDEVMESLSKKVDRTELDGYATKGDLEGIQMPDTSNFATKAELMGKADAGHMHRAEDIEGIPTKVSDLENDARYATEVYVNNKIAEAQLNAGGQVDLSGLATKDELAQKVDKVEGKGLSTNDFTDELMSKLTASHSKVAELEGLLTQKVDKVEGKGLSTNDLTDLILQQINSNTTRVAAVESSLNSVIKSIAYKEQNIAFSNVAGAEVFEIEVVDQADIDKILDFN